MRISGGGARGATLIVPKGEKVRPATDGMRQAVFSSLGDRVVGARFLDLFAGSGAYGLEAFSRGAIGGTFIEQHSKATLCVRHNIASVCKSLGRDVRTADLKVLQTDACAPPVLGESPDLIFIDPPYELIPKIAPMLFARLFTLLSTKPCAVVIFEMPGETDLTPEGWVAIKRLGKGARQPTAVFFVRDSRANENMGTLAAT